MTEGSTDEYAALWEVLLTSAKHNWRGGKYGSNWFVKCGERACQTSKINTWDQVNITVFQEQGHWLQYNPTSSSPCQLLFLQLLSDIPRYIFSGGRKALVCSMVCITLESELIFELEMQSTFWGSICHFQLLENYQKLFNMAAHIVWIACIQPSDLQGM